MGEAARVEIVLGIIHNVCSHTGERNRERIETHGVGVARREPIEEPHEILTLDETCFAQPALFAERINLAEGVGCLLLSVAEVLRIIVVTVTEQEGPVLFPHHGVEPLRIPATTI